MSLSKYYLETSFTPKGVGTWRSLYLDILRNPVFCDYKSILELGAGTPDFLSEVNIDKKVAVDIGEKYKQDFEKDNVGFYCMDLEQSNLSELGQFDVIVCSDVFEHLMSPIDLLGNIKNSISDKGVLFSHVPNEFTLRKTLSVMFAGSESLYFHKEEEEWSDPHFRRFTFNGYKKFLEQFFKYNIYISHLVDRKLLRILRVAGITPPYCLQKGPTFISTNDGEMAIKIKEIIN